VLLVGLMGSGKTVVGQALAARLGWPYIDNDDVVRDLTGTAKESLVEQAGEHGLRVAEAAVVAPLLARDGPFVAGLPAGVVLDPAVRARLGAKPDDAVLVWLRARIPTLVQRLAADPQDRPWLTGDLETAVRELAAGREPHFADLADLTVDVDRGSPDELAATIADRLGLPG
jgi:shikimate kinase